MAIVLNEIDNRLNELFAQWLNRVDAYSDYDWRRKCASIDEWRHLYEMAYSERDAIDLVTAWESHHQSIEREWQRSHGWGS